MRLMRLSFAWFALVAVRVAAQQPPPTLPFVAGPVVNGISLEDPGFGAEQQLVSVLSNCTILHHTALILWSVITLHSKGLVQN